MLWLTKLRLQTRLSLLVVLVLMLIFAFLAWQSVQALQTATHMALDERLALARTVALHLDQDLERTLDRLTEVAVSPAINLEDEDMEPEKAELRALYRSQLFNYVFILDKEGLVLWTEPYLSDVVGIKHLECPHVQEALHTGQPAIACVAHALTPEKPMVSPVVPVRNKEGGVVGVLGGAIDPSSPHFSDRLRRVVPARTGYAQLVDENGLVLAHTQGRRLFQKSEHADLFISLLQKKEAAVATQTVTEEDKGTLREVIAFAPLTVAPWGVAVEQEEAELLAPALELRQRMVLLAMAALAVALLLVWVTARSVIEPVRQLVAASERIAAGDLTTPVPPLGEDEIGELGQAFDDMRQRLARWGEELEAKVAERTRELAALYAIDRAVAQSLDLAEILNDSLDKTLEVLEVEAGGILLIEPDGETMTLQVHQGLSEEFVEAVRHMKLGEGISGQAAAQQKPVVLDVAEYPTERLAPFIAKEGFQTIASTPLMAKGRALGAMTLGTRRPRAFPPGELELLTAIGQQIGVAIENAWLFEETQRRASEMTTLNQVGRALATTLRLDELAEVIYREVTAVMEAAAFFVALYDQETDELDYLIRVDQGMREPPERRPAAGLSGLIVTSGQPILIRNFAQEKEQYPQVRLWGTMEAPDSWLGVPMKVGEQVLGLISVQAYRLEAYDEGHQALLSTIADMAALAVDNARRYAAEERRAVRLAQMVELGAELATQRDEEALLQTLVTSVAALFGSPACTVMLVDEAANEAVLAAQTGLPEGTRLGLRVPLELPIIRRSLETGEPIILPDIDHDAPQVRRLLVRKDIQAFFAYPMRREGRAIGYITLSRLTPHTPSAQEIAACQLLAELAAGALQNARLFQEMGQRLAEISALVEVSGALRGAATVEEMLPIILDKTIEVLRADTGALFRLDERTGELVAQAARGRLEALRGLRLGPSEGVCGYVAQTCAPYPFADLASDPYTGDRVQPLVKGVQGGICVPLMTGERLVGTLIIGSYGPRTFSDNEVRLLTAIADMAASAVHRASLFEQLQARVRELTTVYEAGKTVTATLRIEDVLDFIVGAASGTLHAEASYLFLWDEREERLVMRAVTGFPPELVGQVKYRQGEGLSGWVFLESKPVNVPDVAKDPRWKPEPDQEAPLPSGRVVSALVVPLVVGEKPLGVLGVTNKIGAPAPSTPLRTGFTESDQSLLTVLAGQMAVALENARLYEDVRGLSIATIRSLATAIDARDPYTKGHSDQVARLSMLLARELGWNGADLEMLEFAALLHDVGKIGIPDAVLRKTEPLTPEEWNNIHLHPYHSAQMVKPVEPLQRIIPWIYHHQEWWDGTGYPDGLKGENIPLAARIIAVADAFNAMTTDRPYRKAKSQEEAIEELRRCAGSQFDPQMVEVFVGLLEEE